MVNFYDHKLFEDDMAVSIERLPCIECLSITENVVNAKLLAVCKHLIFYLLVNSY